MAEGVLHAKSLLHHSYRPGARWTGSRAVALAAAWPWAKAEDEIQLHRTVRLGTAGSQGPAGCQGAASTEHQSLSGT